MTYGHTKRELAGISYTLVALLCCCYLNLQPFLLGNGLAHALNDLESSANLREPFFSVAL